MQKKSLLLIGKLENSTGTLIPQVKSFIMPFAATIYSLAEVYNSDENFYQQSVKALTCSLSMPKPRSVFSTLLKFFSATQYLIIKINTFIILLRSVI